MTEQEWLQATDPKPMLKFLGGRASERKLRLFSVACCRRVYHLLTDERSRKAVEVAERFADGEATVEERAKVDEDHYWVATENEESFRKYELIMAVSWCVSAGISVGQPLPLSIEQVSQFLIDSDDGLPPAAQTALLHDIIGNPFRPVSLNSSWLTWHGGLLVSMARQMYDSRDFSDMPVLADALEEAGCDIADILAHCRGPGLHVRGCWVVDLLLGKE
jgi:hypothetical protein